MVYPFLASEILAVECVDRDFLLLDYTILNKIYLPYQSKQSHAKFCITAQIHINGLSSIDFIGYLL